MPFGIDWISDNLQRLTYSNAGLSGAGLPERTRERLLDVAEHCFVESERTSGVSGCLLRRP